MKDLLCSIDKECCLCYNKIITALFFIGWKGEIAMSSKRKDTNGRVLEKGEIQRKDGRYMYRWNDMRGERQTVYATTLDELRKKELDIGKKELYCGINWADGKTNVRDIMNQFIEMKEVRMTTEGKYKFFANTLDKIGFLDMPVDSIRTSNAKYFMKELDKLGYSYGTVGAIKSFAYQIFQTAVEDDYIIKNPFNFKLSNIMANNTKQRISLSEEQERTYLDFIKTHGWFSHCYPDIAILLNTGMRVSELYGLTFRDVDMKKRRIYVNKQLHLINREYHVFPPKSKAGVRTLAMNDTVEEAFRMKMKEKRPTVEYMVDGYSGFIFLNHMRKPKNRRNLMMSMISIEKKWKELGMPEFPHIHPHILRHTFCSRMVDKGMNIKTLQMVMGHSDVSTTLNVYTHKTPEDVAIEMENIVNL